MRILFLSPYKISPMKGGTEHTALTVATNLHHLFGYLVYALHSVDLGDENCSIFEEQKIFPHRRRKQFLRRYVIENKIDVILSQGSFGLTLMARKAIADDLNVQIVFVHHFTPGWEVNHVVFSDYWFALKNNPKSFLPYIKLLGFPISRMRHLLSLRYYYKKTYRESDNVVLLSKTYISKYKKFARLNDVSKFRVIPNALSFPLSYRIQNLCNKENVVLIVSRMDETQKRLSLALKIWEQIKKDSCSVGWKLLIAGEGKDLGNYKRIVSERIIKDVDFLGRVSPISYYEKASIFMMTSKSEGFPLTLNEAMQFAVVPIAFNSFDSLSDILDNDVNGVIVDEDDFEEYVKQLQYLMENTLWRETLARKAFESVERYTPEKVVGLWNSLIIQSI